MIYCSVRDGMRVLKDILEESKEYYLDLKKSKEKK